MNKISDDGGTIGDNKSRRKRSAFLAIASRIKSLAIWAKVLMFKHNVFFTTIANWFSDKPATSTGVRREKV